MASHETAPIRCVAVIGGGINGVMTAWRLAELGCAVDLFERDTLMSATSRSSTKLLHGGVRYLENREFRLVYESLHERTWWVQRAPHYAHALELFLPVYGPGSPLRGTRPRWIIGAGLTLYDLLAGRHTLGRHRWHTAHDVARRFPTLRTDGLHGAYSFFDAQMDDYALGLWAADRAREAGVQIHERTNVLCIDTMGSLRIAGAVPNTAQNNAPDDRAYDRVINAAGPWARQLLDVSGIPARHDLDLVRGSHLLLRGTLPHGVLVQVPGERRVCFILPYQGQILLGTTEVRQSVHDPIVCSDEEKRYLLNVYHAYFSDRKTDTDIISSFAGVRPLLRSAVDPNRASREYAIERTGKLVTVFGGKWTTARALAKRVVHVALA